MYRSFASLLAVAVAINLATGCALTVSGPDPQRPLDEVPRCDTGKAPVVMDGLWATLTGLAAIAAFGDGEDGLGAAMLGVGGLFAASAYKGNRAANGCNAAFDDYNTLLARRRETLEDATTRRDRRRRSPVTPPVATAPAPIEPPPVATGEPPRVPPAAPPPAAPPATAPPPTVPPPNTFGVPRPAGKRPSRPPEPAPADDDWSQFWKVVP